MNTHTHTYIYMYIYIRILCPLQLCVLRGTILMPGNARIWDGGRP
jgi:hypothetical protein